jgi:alpha-D-ribose 1-methylphosphonate 5-triphosphate synthase subunit PhnG
MSDARLDPQIAQRRAVMALCAEAASAELDAALHALAPLPEVRDLRRPETGLTMLRGRAGGDGAAFNVGEATVTRAAVALDGKVTGFAYHLGRDIAKARKAAILDALWQQAERRPRVEAALDPVRLRLETERAQAARQAAATRVNFFTLVRGED